MTRLKRLIVGLGALFAAWVLIHTAVTIWDGLNDELQPSDVAVVLGNRVERSGGPSLALRGRLERALELYRNRTVPEIVVSGGLGSEGFDEADVMCQYLTARGVPSESILKDHHGDNTFLTAQNTKQLMQVHHWNSVVIVSDYYHIPRVRFTFERFGIQNIFTAHADPGFAAWQIPSIFREFFAYYFYLIRDYPQL